MWLEAISTDKKEEETDSRQNFGLVYTMRYHTQDLVLLKWELGTLKTKFEGVLQGGVDHIQ